MQGLEGVVQQLASYGLDPYSVARAIKLLAQVDEKGFLQTRVVDMLALFDVQHVDTLRKYLKRLDNLLVWNIVGNEIIRIQFRAYVKEIQELAMPATAPAPHRPVRAQRSDSAVTWRPRPS